MAEAVYQIIFYLFTIALLGSAAMVVFSRNPVRCILFLVMAFFCSAVLWMLLQAEFLSLVLDFCLCRRGHDAIPVRGDDAQYRSWSPQRRFCPLFTLWVVGFGVMVGVMLFVLNSGKQFSSVTMLVDHGPNYNNTAAIGN